MRVVKAEVLITRRCNLRCGYCNMPIRGGPDRTILPERWCTIFDTLTKKLGCSFYAIYGAEPTLYPGLYDVIEHLNGLEGAAYSVLTNGVTFFRGGHAAKMLDAGVQSITLSLDGIMDLGLDRDIAGRSSSSALVLNWALQNALEDIQVTSTVHAFNLGRPILDLIAALADKGVWFSFDFVHDNKRDEGYGASHSKAAGRSSDFSLDETSPSVIYDFLVHVMSLKEQGYLIYQSMDWLEFLADDVERRVIKREWVCSPYPAWVSIDQDGTLLVCDDFLISSKIPAEHLPQQWDKFVRFREGLIEVPCRGCAWSTHWMAYEQLEMGKEGARQVSHGRV